MADAIDEYYSIDCAYVFGYTRGTNPSSHPPTLAVLHATAKGWRCRSSCRGALNHDYVSYESLSDIIDWLRLNLERPYVTLDREETLERLTRPCAWSGVRQSGFVEGDPMWEDSVRAERALEHLELGW